MGTRVDPLDDGVDYILTVLLTLLQIVKKRELQMKSPIPTLPAMLPSVKPAMPQVPLPQTTLSPRDRAVQQSQLTESNTIATTGSAQPGQVPATASVNLPYQSEPQLSLGSASEAQGQPLQYPSLPPQEENQSLSEPPQSNVVTPSPYSITSRGLQGSSQQVPADTVAVVKNGSSEALTEPQGIAELILYYSHFTKPSKVLIVVSLCLKLY